MDWTDPQREAIEHDGGDLLVAAGAGTGKTGVLTERVVRKVAAGECSITELLVVTFTDAAAGQMRRRIAGRLAEALAEARAAADPARAARLGRQIVLLDAGQVSTLHSFCSHLLREHFHHLGLDPSFEILDEDEAALVRQEVLDELLADYYDAPEEPETGRRVRFRQLLEWLGGGRDEEPLRRTILRLDAKVNSLASPEAWWRRVGESLSAQEAGPAGSLAESAWGGPVRRLLELDFESASARLDQAQAMASVEGAGELGRYLAPTDKLIDYLARLRACLSKDGFWDEVGGLLEDYPIGRLVSVPADTPGKGPLKGLLDGVKRSLGALRGLTRRHERDLLADLAALAPQAQTLAELCRGYQAAYTAAKRDRGQLDFADLERYALRLLSEFEEVRSAVSAQFREVLVDEYQDISPVQDAILRAVAGRGGRDAPDSGRGDAGRAPGRLFMVGDLKQSIYRFRLAEPDIFAETLEAFSAGGGEGGPTGGRLIHLADNFRSRRVIIDAVNAVFEQLMLPMRTPADGAGGPAGPVYDEAARLRFKAPPYERADAPPDAPVELHLLAGELADGGEGAGDEAAGTAPGDEHGEPAAAADDAGELERTRIQARLIGRRVRQLLGADGGEAATVWDEQAARWRPARPRDVVVLLRTAVRVARKFAEELTAMGLPVHATQPGGYFEAVEVNDVRSLLAVLDNPRQDIPLAAVLRSPLMAFAGGALSADELAAVRLADPEGQFYDALLAASGTAGGCGDAKVDASLRERIARWLAQLGRWRTMARRRPLGELLADIFRVTGYLDYVSGLAGGPQRRANLLHLAQRARQFDTFARQGLARFARFLDELERAGEQLGIPGALSEAEDVVRIMTVHGAKGLEFPIVVLADLEHQFNLQDCRQDVLFHRQLLLGLRCLDRRRRIRYASLPHHLIASQLRFETSAEEMRLLYVAMTRARDRLILVGSDRSPAARLESGWRRRPGPATVLAAGRPLDWLAPAILSGPPGRAVLDRLDKLDSLPGEPLVGGDGTFRIHVYGAACLADLVGGADRPGQPSARPRWRRAVESGRPLPPAPGEPDEHDRKICDAVSRRLGFRYPLQPLTGQPAKRTVSELKALFETRAEADEQVAQSLGMAQSSGRSPGKSPGESPVKRPGKSPGESPGKRPGKSPGKSPGESPVKRPGKSPGMAIPGLDAPTDLTPPWERPATTDARARGLATHAVLQRLDLAAPLADAGQVASQVASLQAQGLLEPHQASLVDADAIAAFFATDLGRLMRERRDRVRREWAFSLGVGVDEILGAAGKRGDSHLPESREVSSSTELPQARGFPSPGLGREDVVLVQGIIDVLLELDDGTLMVLDFKTDAVRTDEQVARRVQAYGGQIRWYGRAAEAILGRPVSRRLIYFLTPQRLAEVPAAQG